MNAFDDFYRRHTELNYTGFGIEIWRKQKERDGLIWEAALEWAKAQAEEDCFADLHNWIDKNPDNHRMQIETRIIEKELEDVQ